VSAATADALGFLGGLGRRRFSHVGSELLILWNVVEVP
jgi:hypothetical protein